MNLKKPLAAALSALVVIGGIIGYNTVTASAMTEERAKEAAMQQVPATAELVRTEDDWSKYEFSFKDDKGEADYEVEVSKKKEMVTEVTMESYNDAAGAKKSVKEKKAKAIAQELFPEATIDEVRLAEDEDGYTYEISFTGNGYYGEVELNAETGDVNEYEINFGTATVIPMGETDSKKSDSSKKVEDKTKTGEASSVISEDEAIAIVLDKVPGATITEIELDWEDGIPQYEGDAVLDNTEYEFEINATTGIITAWEEEAIEAAGDYDYDDDDDYDYDDDDSDYDDDDDDYDDDRDDYDDDDDRYDDDDDDDDEDDDDDDDD